MREGPLCDPNEHIIFLVRRCISSRPSYSQDGQGGSMMTIRKEVRELISANEKIHSAIAHGERLTDGEKRLVEICASELIASMSKKQKRRFGYQHSRLV